jgi:hypothetical protein
MWFSYLFFSIVVLVGLCSTQTLPNVPDDRFADDTHATDTQWRDEVRYALGDARVLAQMAMRVPPGHEIFRRYFVGTRAGPLDAAQGPERYYTTVMRMFMVTEWLVLNLA